MIQLGQLRRAAEFERAAAEFALECVERKRLVRIRDFRSERAERRRGLRGHARTLHIHVEREADVRFSKRAADAQIECGRAVDAPHGWRKFWNNGER